MNAEELKEIFEKEFNLNSWIQVLRENLSVKTIYNPPKPISIIKNDNPFDADPYELGRLITKDDQEIGIYKIDVPKVKQLHRNKVGLRSLLKNVYKNDVDAALVVFVQDKKWRFSYISEVTKRNKETGKRETLKTDPKRYTYLLGKGEKAKTAADRFASIQQSDDLFGEGVTLKALEKAFSVERMSKDFFNDYRKHYGKFLVEIIGKDENDKQVKESSNIFNSVFQSDEIKAKDFVKRLLGRIVFLYFLEKKGWLGVPSDKNWGDGDENFLSNLFFRCKKKESFYSDVLRPLFFESLNEERRDDLFKIDTNLFSSTNYNKLKIPFLNGGLFEKEDEDTDQLNLPVLLFKDLFDFFDRYNFTVHEDSPFEHTVAVDPEMLGHIFENLLEDNKGKGAFYTPKEIVHFMCQESIIEYLCVTLENVLKNDKNKKELRSEIEFFIRNKELGNLDNNEELIIKALKDIKVCDPAIGSGAFPMGILLEIFHTIESLHFAIGDTVDRIWNLKDGWDPAEVKLSIIQNSIYGVDIEPGAVDIARLRFWLSLVVEEEIKIGEKPKPLPNLDFKIISANTLIPSGYNEFLELAERTQAPTLLRMDGEIQRLQTIRDDFFDESDRSKKTGLKELFTSTRNYILSEFKSLKSSYKLGDFLEVLSEWEPFKDIACKWFDEWWMFGVKEGFDIVIGNPPYVQLQKDGGKLSKQYQNYKYETFERTGDIYSLFYEKGVNLLKDKGILCYITSNKWMRANYGSSTRQFFVDKTHPLLVIDFGNVQIFDTATVDTNILLLQNKPKAKKHDNKDVIGVRFEKDFILSETNISEYINRKGYSLSNLNQNSWVVGQKDIYKIKSIVEEQGIIIKNWILNINRGIVTGFNEAFIIDSKTKEKIISKDSNSSKIIKPILRGKDIEAWHAVFEDYWLIGTFPSRKLNIDDYPGIMEHLLSYDRARLEQNGKGRKKTGNKWFETQDQINYWEEFEKPKLIFPNMTKYLPFVYDETGVFTNQKCFIITGEKLKYLTCFFNSKLFKYCFSDNFPELQGGTRELSKVFFDKIPVKQVSNLQEIPFAKMVDFLSELRKENSSETTDQFMFLYFEQIANALVFELYFNEEFNSRNLKIAKYIETLPDLNDIEKPINQLRNIYVSINQQNHPLKQALFTMLSIPQIELIMNNN